MTTAIRRATFNGNQFITPAKWRSDLLDRMSHVDRVLLQEAVHFDCAGFVADPKVIARVGEWGAIQTRVGNQDGRANTAILYRISAGVPSQHVLVDLGRATGPAKDQHTRERFLCAALFPEGWDGSFHGFPARDGAFNPPLIAKVGAWVKGVTEPIGALGADINQIPPAHLEQATGLRWHGVGIDGFLGDVAQVAEFPKGFSDHAGVHSVSKEHPVKSLFQRVRALLKRLRSRSTKAGRATRAAKADAARKALAKKKAAPKPPTITAPHGFMPGALVKNIAPGSNDPAIIPCGVVYHVAVSESPSLFDFFSHDGGIESHFYVRRDGTIEQYRSIFFEADAQFAGNSFGSPRQGFISIETQGMGTGEWEAEQVASLKAITRWVHSQTAFPLRVCPAWNAPGVGYHALFTEWNTDHHSCPGPDRIAQFKRVFVPWLAGGAK